MVFKQKKIEKTLMELENPFMENFNKISMSFFQNPFLPKDQ